MVEKNRNNIFFLLGAAALLVSCVLLFITVQMYFGAQRVATSGSDSAIDTAHVLSSLVKLTNLPTGETPKLVSIPDLAPFAKQAFFSRARVGDVLVVYTANHLAILYDPAQNKIVNMNRITVIIPPSVALP